MAAADAKDSTDMPLRPRTAVPRQVAGRPAVLTVLLVLLVAAAYLPVHRHPFVNYDDLVYVTENPHVRSGLNWGTVGWAFRTFETTNWHPLTWLSHALDVQLHGLNPAGHHDTSVLFHAANSALLFLVLWRATGCLWRSFSLAALFAVLPINIESVAWISERKNLLSLLFFLLTLGAYVSYAKRRGALRYLLVVFLFALGLMSKPQVITLPFVLLLWDYWPLERVALRSLPFAFRGKTEGGVPGKMRMANSEKRTATGGQRLLLEKLPLFVLAAASAVVTIIAQRPSLDSLQRCPLSIRLENTPLSYARYIGKIIWPVHLGPMYPYPSGPLPALQVLSAVLLLAAITGFVVRHRTHRYLVVGWLWFLGTLVPMIGLVQVGNQAMADRYAYLPGIGLLIMICWGLSDWAKAGRAPAVLMPTLLSAAVLALVISTRHQIAYWQDNVILWTHTLQITGDNYIAQDNLAFALLQHGRLEEAMAHFRKAAEINPADATSLLKIAMYEQDQRHWPNAIMRYTQLLGVAGGNRLLKARALTNLGYVYLRDNDSERAGSSWQEAVALDSENGRAWMGLGILAQRGGKIDLAITNYNRGLSFDPVDVGYLLLAQALDAAGETQEGASARDRARQMSKDFTNAQRTADELLGPAGRR